MSKENPETPREIHQRLKAEGKPFDPADESLRFEEAVAFMVELGGIPERDARRRVLRARKHFLDGRTVVPKDGETPQELSERLKVEGKHFYLADLAFSVEEATAFLVEMVGLSEEEAQHYVLKARENDRWYEHTFVRDGRIIARTI
jgi:hypothetical protein